MNGLRVHSNVLIDIALAINLVRFVGECTDDDFGTSVRTRIVSLGQLACGVLSRHDGSGLKYYLQDFRCFVLLVGPMRHNCMNMVM